MQLTKTKVAGLACVSVLAILAGAYFVAGPSTQETGSLEAVAQSFKSSSELLISLPQHVVCDESNLVNSLSVHISGNLSSSNNEVAVAAELYRTIGMEFITQKTVVVQGINNSIVVDELITFENIDITEGDYTVRVFTLGSDIDGTDVRKSIDVLCICGNGIVEEGEECDDGNVTNGDGCSSSCNIEGEFYVEISDENIVCEDGIAEDIDFTIAGVLPNTVPNNQNFDMESWILDSEGNIIYEEPVTVNEEENQDTISFNGQVDFNNINLPDGTYTMVLEVCMGSIDCTEYTLEFVVDCVGGSCETQGVCVSGDYGNKLSCAGFTTEVQCLGFTQNVGPNGEIVSVCNWESECACGDGEVNEGEECDDGNVTNGDGCNGSCEVEETTLNYVEKIDTHKNIRP